MSLTDVDVAIRAAEAGAAVVRSKYGTDLVRHAKAPGDFTTDAGSTRGLRTTYARTNSAARPLFPEAAISDI